VSAVKQRFAGKQAELKALIKQSFE
jgi:hypothetical protein